MCILIFQSPNKVIPKDDIYDYARRNNDGFGLMYVDNNKKLCIEHTLSSTEFYSIYSDRVSKFGSTSPMVLHFRLGTGGKKDITNCHPFSVNEDIGMAHNGIIHKAPSNAIYSDTYLFNEYVCKPLGKDIFENKNTRELINDYIGSANKIIFLSSEKNYIIFNEDMGEWKDGIWYSFKAFVQTYRGSLSNWKMCSKCKKEFHLSEVFMISTPSYVSAYICKHCVNKDTKISEVVSLNIYDNLPWEDGYC